MGEAESGSEGKEVEPKACAPFEGVRESSTSLASAAVPPPINEQAIEAEAESVHARDLASAPTTVEAVPPPSSANLSPREAVDKRIPLLGSGVWLTGKIERLSVVCKTWAGETFRWKRAFFIACSIGISSVLTMACLSAVVTWYRSRPLVKKWEPHKMSAYKIDASLRTEWRHGGVKYHIIIAPEDKSFLGEFDSAVNYGQPKPSVEVCLLDKAGFTLCTFSGLGFIRTVENNTGTVIALETEDVAPYCTRDEFAEASDWRLSGAHFPDLSKQKLVTDSNSQSDGSPTTPPAVVPKVVTSPSSPAVSAASSNEQTAREIARTANRSVVLLETNTWDDSAARGSGFFVSEDVIATNAHVIKDANRGTAKLVGSSQKFQIIKTIAIDRQNDLALIKVDGIGPPLRLSTTGAPSIGDKVYVVGNPKGLEGTFSDGMISGIRTFGPVRRLQMTAPISAGSSGGPVMDANGSVIGISVEVLADGQNLNFAVPVSYLSALLASSSDRTVTPPRLQEEGEGIFWSK